jgi:hypothetical protein
METDRQRAGWSAIFDGRAASELDELAAIGDGPAAIGDGPAAVGGGPAANGDGPATEGERLGKERRRAGKIEVGAPVKKTNGE